MKRCDRLDNGRLPRNNENKIKNHEKLNSE